MPYTRKVKVPVKVKKVVRGKERKTIPVRKVVVRESVKEVDEDYMEQHEVEKTREKEVWVKQIVEEKYTELVDVKKTRKKQVPVSEEVEIETTEEVEVDVEREVEVDGFRVDEVQDTKIIEVEEYQTFRLQAVPIGSRQVSKTTEKGIKKGSHLNRTTGRSVFLGEEVEDISDDEDADPLGGRTSRTPQLSTRLVKSRMDLRSRQAARAAMPQHANRPLSRAAADVTNRLASRQTTKMNGTSNSLNASGFVPGSGIGCMVKKIDRGLRVSKVHFGQPAFKGGLREGDIIKHINNAPTNDKDQFAAALRRNGGLLRFGVVRGGVPMEITVLRQGGY